MRDGRLSVRKALATLLPYAVLLLLTILSWNRWIEPYVDSGRELMVPRRIARGEALYREVRFYHGPLGPYLAAAVETAAGRSLPARIVLAAAVALLHLEALRRLALRWLPPLRAALATSLVVAATFFLRPGGCHLFPFSLDTAIAAAAIAWSLLLASAGASGHAEARAGGCLLAALLSRPEMGLAAAAVVLLEAKTTRRALALAALPIAAAAVVYALLSRGTPYETLRREGWLAIVGPPEAFRNVYSAYAGLDRPGLRLAELALAAILLLLVACLLVASAALAQHAGHWKRGGAAAVAAAPIALLLVAAIGTLRPAAGLAHTLSLLPPLVRVVPVGVLAAALSRLARRVAGRRGDRGAPPVVPDAVLFVAALLSARLLLAAGYVGPYNGFLLPLPLLVAVTLLFLGADRLSAVTGPTLPDLTAAALGVLMLFRLAVSRDVFRHAGWSRVETAAGPLFLLEPVASTTRLAVADLSARLPPGSSLLGFPEGGFLNYALGSESPLPQEQFFPGHLDAAEEEATVRRLATRPPAALLYVNVLAVGHGSTAFGSDYLRILDRFARSRFAPVACYGPGSVPGARIGDPHFFIEVRVPGSGGASR